MAKKSKKAVTEATEATEVPVEAPTGLPKGISQEMYDEVKATIISGFDAKQDPDAIKSAIFSSGVPFSKLNKLYIMITTSEGLVASPKEITEGIAKGVAAAKLTFEESYADLAVFMEDICDEIQGATQSKVLSAFKKVFKENEVDFPRKPAPSRGRMGVVSKTLINVFKGNPNATEKDCTEALIPVTKTPANAEHYAKQYHKMCYALTHRLSALEVLTKFSKDA